MSEEPFDPTPTDAQERAHLHMSLATKHLKLAVVYLEAIHPERQREILAVLEEAVKIRNEMS